MGERNDADPCGVERCLRATVDPRRVLRHTPGALPLLQCGFAAGLVNTAAPAPPARTHRDRAGDRASLIGLRATPPARVRTVSKHFHEAQQSRRDG